MSFYHAPIGPKEVTSPETSRPKKEPPPVPKPYANQPKEPPAILENGVSAVIQHMNDLADANPEQCVGSQALNEALRNRDMVEAAYEHQTTVRDIRREQHVRYLEERSQERREQHAKAAESRQNPLPPPPGLGGESEETQPEVSFARPKYPVFTKDATSGLPNTGFFYDRHRRQCRSRHANESRGRMVTGGLAAHEHREATHERMTVAPKANYLPSTIWIDPSDGTKFHTRPTCPGLDRAMQVRAYMRCAYCAQEHAVEFELEEHSDEMRFIGHRPSLTDEEIVQLNRRFSVQGVIKRNRENIQETE